MAKRIVNVNIDVEISDDDAMILDGKEDSTYWDHLDIIESALANGNYNVRTVPVKVYNDNFDLINKIGF